MTATADLTKVLDKEYQDKSLAEIVAAPVATLKGVSEGDAALLAQAFNIKTVGDLGTNKFSGPPSRSRHWPTAPADGAVANARQETKTGPDRDGLGRFARAGRGT
jgi:hypothetical protein